MTRKKKPVIDPKTIVLQFQRNIIQQELVSLLSKHSDAELEEYGNQCVANIKVLYSWAKRAMLGLATTEELAELYFTPEMPNEVQALLRRVIAKLEGKSDAN